MPTIRRKTTADGSTRWEAQVRLRDVPPTSATFRTRAQAQAWAASKERELREARAFGFVPSARFTLGDAVARYLAGELRLLAPSEQPRRASQLRRWTAELGAARPLASISPADVAAVRDRLADAVSPARVNRYLAALSRLFTVARTSWHLARDNPAAHVAKMREPPGRALFLDREQAAALLSACHLERSPDLAPLATLALATGARSGELLALEWRDVDLAAGRATFRRTKNGSDRTVPLAGLARVALLERLRPGTPPTGRVFPRPFPRDAFDRAKRRAGLAPLRFHDLRHTFASWLAMAGATLPELAEALGHRTLAMVRRYAHFTAGHTAAVVGRALERFGLA
ncbi:MAG: site-specific integrase [Myxococcales bacterium]|nr:site-specific integrase [Myxococcales bacterium]